MWDSTKTGWLMALRDSDDSAWGDVGGFYNDIRQGARRRNGQLIYQGDVWGKYLRKDHAPEPGDGIAFYHSTKAKFVRPDPYGRRPRISLIAEILDVRCGSQKVDWLKFAIDERLLEALSRYPIVKNESTDDLFFSCGIGTGAFATFYPADHRTWRQILRLAKKAERQAA
jgi:hypothetical protein